MWQKKALNYHIHKTQTIPQTILYQLMRKTTFAATLQTFDEAERIII